MLLQRLSLPLLVLIPYVIASPTPSPQDPTPGGDPGSFTIGKGSCNGGEVAQIQSGSCKPGFLNTVFNVDVAEAVWNTIRAHNVSNFSMLCTQVFLFCMLIGVLQYPSGWTVRKRIHHLSSS